MKRNTGFELGSSNMYYIQSRTFYNTFRIIRYFLFRRKVKIYVKKFTSPFLLNKFSKIMITWNRLGSLLQTIGEQLGRRAVQMRWRPFGIRANLEHLYRRFLFRAPSLYVDKALPSHGVNYGS